MNGLALGLVLTPRQTAIRKWPILTVPIPLRALNSRDGAFYFTISQRPSISRLVYRDNVSAYHLTNTENKLVVPQPRTDYVKRSSVLQLNSGDCVSWYSSS